MCSLQKKGPFTVKNTSLNQLIMFDVMTKKRQLLEIEIKFLAKGLWLN